MYLRIFNVIVVLLTNKIIYPVKFYFDIDCHNMKNNYTELKDSKLIYIWLTWTVLSVPTLWFNG